MNELRRATDAGPMLAARWARAVAGLLVLVVVVDQALAIARPAARPGLNFACQCLLDLTGAALAVRASRHGQRAAWLLVGAGQLVTLATNGCMGLATITGRSGWFWLGSTTGVLMYVLFALAMIAFPAQRLRGWQLAGLAAEALAVLGCGFMYVWYFVLQPLVIAGTGGEKWPLRVGFPLGDLLLLVGLSVVVLRGGLHRHSAPLTLLVTGLGAFLLADTAFSAVGDDGNHATGPLIATLTGILSTSCITLAALWQASAGRTGGGEPVRRDWAAAWFSYLPYAAVGFGLALMVVVTLRDGQWRTWGGLVLGLSVVTTSIALRQIVSLRETRQHAIADPLTGLANRTGFNHRLTRALRRGEPVAVLLIDLDGFKAVNDTHGHHAGDLLLSEFAALLTRTTRTADLAARIGGDEFAVVQVDVTDEADSIALARRILAGAAATVLRVGEHEISPRASIGVALAAPGDTLESLGQHADIAMYQAKRAGTHDLVCYREGMLDRRADDAALGRDLENAVASGQLRVLYQPMIDLGSGRPIGAEALVRWQHPVRGLVAPLDFIPIAEHTGAIGGVGRFVLEQACREVQTWPGELYASVNLSPRQLQDPGLVAEVLAVLTATGLDPGRLVLEITESAIIDERLAIPAIETLRARGIRIAIDDFGTGYSSLHYLSRLPVDILKIDRSFVAELDGSRNGSAITEAVIRLAQILELTTVAEGIETEEQAGELVRLDCNVGQGFLYARPLPSSDLRDFLARLEPAEPSGDQIHYMQDVTGG